MSAINNTLITTDLIGRREDLSSKIYNISPEETPYISAIGREKAESTFSEWQQDALAARNTGNAVPEGDDIATFPAVDQPVRLGVYAQISRKEWIISDTAEEANLAGRKSERAYHKAKTMVAIRMDVEAIAMENQATVGTGTRLTAGLGAWVKTNVDKGSAGVNPVYTTLPNATRSDTTQRSFTKTQTDAVITSCWTNGAKPSLIFVGGFNKTVFSTFSGLASHQVQINGPKQTFIVAGATVYVSNFGNLTVVPNRNQRARDAWFIDPDYAAVAMYRDFKSVKLAKTGDAEKEMIVVEWQHRVKHEKGLGLVADLTTA